MHTLCLTQNCININKSMFTLPIQALMRVRTEEDGENEDENEEEGEDKK